VTAFETCCWLVAGIVIGWICSGYTRKYAIELAVARRTMELREDLYRTTLRCIALSAKLRDIGEQDP
jgi:hypothetical protein